MPKLKSGRIIALKRTANAIDLTLDTGPRCHIPFRILAGSRIYLRVGQIIDVIGHERPDSTLLAVDIRLLTDVPKPEPSPWPRPFGKPRKRR